MKIQNIYKLFKEHPFVSTDTRNIKSNSLFFALKGENFDGNKFAQTAIASGAKFAIVDDPSFQVSNKHILVPNALACLQELAAHHRKQLDIPIIGITGTMEAGTTSWIKRSRARVNIAKNSQNNEPKEFNFPENEYQLPNNWSL